MATQACFIWFSLQLIRSHCPEQTATHFTKGWVERAFAILSISASFTFDNAQKALDEDDNEFIKIVLQEMKRLNIIEEKNGHYFFR